VTFLSAEMAFSPTRVGALVMRYLYLMRSSWPRLAELVYWPAVQMLTWGFLQTYIRAQAGASGVGGAMAVAGGTLIGSLLLWDTLFRCQLGFSVSFMEEMWSRNIANLLISPLRPIEFVAALMAMPEAKGLFHKAINQSGPFLRFATPEDSGLLAAAVLSELNLTKSQLAQIHDIPVERLINASQAALKKVAVPAAAGAVMGRIGWGPTVDLKVVPTHPFDPVAPAISADVPYLLGTNLNEGVSGVDNPEVNTLTREQLRDRA